ncbi:MAG: hypothetical protein COB67_13330 [SAR324 cluster bacterium]|uniref:protein-glutamate methylesterase n=1 Tax=SAR324 cluster bacterium TaxID=2024889 RepID=A0A2A4SNC0_9DELT|nr:MAG: hypothetical protein COB67_13330 [SAR324 cluster bacterium]
MKDIKVLIIDNAAVARQVLTEILTSDPALEVVGTAVTMSLALKKIKKLKPDVVTLDIDFPAMHGLALLVKLIRFYPIPVVIISAFSGVGNWQAFQGLELGAIDIIEKPRVGVREHLHEKSIQIIDTVKAASQIRIKPRVKDAFDLQNNAFTKTVPTPKKQAIKRTILKVKEKLSVDVILPRKTKHSLFIPTETIIAIGASTGGTEAIQHVLQDLPLNTPGIVIVQHMPEIFTHSFVHFSVFIISAFTSKFL